MHKEAIKLIFREIDMLKAEKTRIQNVHRDICRENLIAIARINDRIYDYNKSILVLRGD